MSAGEDRHSIQKVDVTEHIRNEVRKVLIASIPDEQMDLIIKNEFAAFWDEGGHGSYPYRETGAGRKIIHAELERCMREAVRKWIDDHFVLEWDGMNMPKLVGELVKEMAPIVQASIISDITQRTLSMIKDRL